MRAVGYYVSGFLSIIVYILWLLRLPQLNSFIKSIPDSLGMQFLAILLGIIIIFGGSLIIIVIWYLIWRPEE